LVWVGFVKEESLTIIFNGIKWLIFLWNNWLNLFGEYWPYNLSWWMFFLLILKESCLLIREFGRNIKFWWMFLLVDFEGKCGLSMEDLEVMENWFWVVFVSENLTEMLLSSLKDLEEMEDFRWVIFGKNQSNIWGVGSSPNYFSSFDFWLIK
jgi:hypothetical protein